jgi:c-di-GMP-binding flagellar brake protein YcgR
LKSVTTEKKVKIYIPSDFSFYERRKHERLIPTKNIYLSFELNKSLFKKTIFDISLGGFAIILPKTDKINIVKGKEFPLVILDLIDRKLKLKVECTGCVSIDRYKNENLPYGGFKIAFRIINITKEDKEYLTEYVIHQLIIQKGIKKAT